MLDLIGSDRVFAPWFSGYYETSSLKVPFDDISDLHDFLDVCAQASRVEVGGMEKILAILEYENPDSAAEAKHVVECIDEFVYVGGIKEYSELGRWVIESEYGRSAIEMINNYTDYEMLGRDYFNNFEYGCGFTDTGYVERTEHFITLYDLEQQELQLE
ncbi:MAG: antirestriction protein ArdA [Oscillospiraceae bacterium]|nr:antirestriction protein ArdA [Oscillospiraceae bacterium]